MKTEAFAYNVGLIGLGLMVFAVGYAFGRKSVATDQKIKDQRDSQLGVDVTNLQLQLSEAIAREDYIKAASIRDRINELETIPQQS